MLAGGKFANGAITGAFAQLYNAEATLYRAAGQAAAQRIAVTAGTAATLAVLDGPSPILDLVGAGWLVYDSLSAVAGIFYSDESGSSSASTLEPGPYADESIPARGPGRDFTPEERDSTNQIGGRSGCHTCGSRDPGTRSGNFIPDHQPPSALNPAGGPQRLYPHCLGCSRTQGGQVRQLKP